MDDLKLDNPFDLGVTERLPKRAVTEPLAVIRPGTSQTGVNEEAYAQMLHMGQTKFYKSLGAQPEPVPMPSPAAPQQTVPTSTPDADGLINIEPPPAQPLPGEDIVSRIDAIQKQDEQDRIRLAEATEGVARTTLDPGPAKEALRYLAAFPDLTPEYVAKHLPELRAQARAQQFDWKSLIDEHPVFAKVVGDPKYASLALDDAALLNPLEAALTGRWERYTYKARETYLGLPFDVERTGLRMTTPPIWAQIIKGWSIDKDKFLWNAQKLLGITPELPDFNPVTGRRYDVLTNEEEAKARAEYEQYLNDHSPMNRDYRGDVGRARRLVGDAFLFPVKIAPTIAGTVAAGAATGGMGLGAFAGTMTFNTIYSAPSLFESMSNMKNEKGESMSPTQARVAAFLGAPMLGYVMSKGLGPTFAGYAAAGLERAGAQTLGRALAEETALSAFGSWARKSGAHVAEGAATFALQNGLDNAIHQLAGKWALGIETRPGEAARAMWDGFKQGLADMPVLASFGGGRDLLQDWGRVRRASETAAKWRVMQDAEESAKHPEVVEEMHKQSAAEPGSARTAYVDREIFEDVSLKNNLDPKQVMAEVMGDGGAAYEQAVKLSASDLAIPLQQARKLLRSKVFSEMMTGEARLDPSDVSIGEVTRREKRWQKIAQDAAAIPVEQMDPEQSAIYKDFYDKVFKSYETTNLSAEHKKIVADAEARRILGTVSRFRAQTGDKDSLLLWYDRTYGKAGVWSASRTEKPGNSVRLKLPPEAVKTVFGAGDAGEFTKATDWVGLSGTGKKGRHFVLIANNALPSTAAHEMTHLYVRVLRDLIGGEHGDVFRKTGDELAKALGHDSWDAWEANRTVLAGEKLAHAYEQFVLEGKAPSLALAQSFARMSQLFSSILKTGWSVGDERFKNRMGASGPALTPELRTFFQRMLAAPEEIKRAQEFIKAGLPFVVATKNMTDEQKAEYAKLLEGHEASAHELLLKMITDASRKENHAFLKNELGRFELAIRAKIDRGELPEYAAARFFRGKGGYSPAAEALLKSPDGKPLRFSAEEILSKLGQKDGQEVIDLLKEKFGPSSVGDKNTVDAEQLANFLGFVAKSGWEVAESPDSHGQGGEFKQVSNTGFGELINRLREMKPEDEYVKETALQQLRDKYDTDLIDHPEKLQQAAMDAVLNPKMWKKITMEMNALVREIDPARAARMKIIKSEVYAQVADRLLNNMRLSELRPEAYANAMAKATVKARELAKAGDAGKAWDALDGALINMALYKAAREMSETVQKQFDRIINRATSESWIRALGLADPENPVHQRAHTAILKSLEILPVRDGEQPAGEKVIDDLLRYAAKHGQENMVDGWDQTTIRALLSGYRKWTDLRPEEAQDVYNAIVNIQHLARDMREIRVGEKTMELERAASELRFDLEKLPFKGKAPADMAAISALREPGLKIQAILASTEDFNTWCNLIGPSAKKFLWDTYTEAKYKKFEIEQKVVKTMKDATEKLGEGVLDSMHDVLDKLDEELPIPESINLAGPRTRGWLVMVMLNMGNEGNRGRLLRGMGWSPEDVRYAAEKYLSPEIMDFVQTVWSMHDDYLWPLIEAKEMRRKGIAPEKVIASPLTLTFNGKDHEYKGGYFVARYDQRAGAKPLELAAERTESGPVRMKPATYKSYTHGRADTYADVMDLQWGVLPSHLSEVVHDLAFDEWVGSTNKLLFNRKFQIPDALYQYLGEERAKHGKGFLAATAQDGSSTVAPELARVFGMLEGGRSRIVMGSLGYNVPVAMADILHPIAVSLFGKVPMRDMATVMARLPFDYFEMRDFARARSKELQIRLAHEDPMLREQVLVAMRGGQQAWRKPIDAIQRNAFVLLNSIDHYTSTAVWMAKYREMIRKGMAEDYAVKMADETVNSSMPTHLVNEMPAILRDHRTMGSLLLFQGYWNKLFQMARLNADDAYKAWREPGADPMGALGTSAVKALRVAAGLAVTSVLGDWVMGHGKEEDESWGEWWGRKMTAAPFALLPFAANIAEPLSDKLWTGKVRGLSVRQAPFLAAMQMVSDNIGRMASDSREPDQKVWDAIELALFAMRLPYRQPRRTGEFLTNVVNGDEDPDGLFALDMVYGKRARQSAGPATIFR